MNPNIDIYLRSAFKELDAFAIPQIGTFRKIHRAAHIASQVGELRPPVLEIEFDTEVRDSLLLTAYLTNNIHMGRAEAEQIVADISQTISRALKSRRKFEITEIGLLRRNAEGKVSFSTSQHNRSIFTDDYFGLQPLQYTSPTQAVEIEQRSSLNDFVEEQVQEQVAQTSTSALKTVFMVGLILMLGITIIYTARTERATLITGVKLANRDYISQNHSPIPISEENRGATDKTSEFAEREMNETVVDLNNTTHTAELKTEDTFSNENDPEHLNASTSVKDNSQKQSQELFAANQTSRLNTEFDELDGSNTRSINTDEGTTRGGQQEGKEDIDIGILSQQDRGLSQAGQKQLFYLIFASFTSAKKAKEHVRKIKAELPAYEAVVLYPPKGSSRPYRVSIYRSADENKVNQVMNRLKKKGYNDIWVFEEK